MYRSNPRENVWLELMNKMVFLKDCKMGGQRILIGGAPEIKQIINDLTAALKKLDA